MGLAVFSFLGLQTPRVHQHSVPSWLISSGHGSNRNAKPALLISMLPWGSNTQVSVLKLYLEGLVTVLTPGLLGLPSSHRS